MFTNSETLYSLKELIPAAAAIIGVATMLGVAICVMRYFISPEDPDQRLAHLKMDAMRVVGVGVACALLASAGYAGRVYEYFADTGGMDDIEASAAAAATAQKPFSPQTSAWSSLNFSQHPDYPEASAVVGVPEWAFNTKVNTEALPANSGTRWAYVYNALRLSYAKDVEDLEEDAYLVRQLKSYGLVDINDPVLFDKSLTAEGAGIVNSSAR